MLKEYIVSLNRGINYDRFWEEIETLSSNDGFVPSRRVDIVNNRDGSTRSCHYALSDEEADILRKDPRIFSVEIPPDQRTDIVMRKRGMQGGNFNKPTTSSGDFLNWGLVRSNYVNNVYGTGLTTSEDYNYLLDGTGVDVVIQDSGIELEHPEFRDDEGNSRIQQINWYTESGISGTQNANHYRDFDGHGTHVAAISVGKTFGWAKNARIYSLKVRGLEGAGDSSTGIIVADCFDVIKLWHRNKPVDPKTGFKRPTIVNMSWGYFYTYLENNINSVTYRGTTYTDTDTLTDASYRWSNYGLIPLTDGTFYYTNVRVGSADADIQEMIDEGIHICIAAGNQYHKIDVPGGDDYDNYITVSGSPNNYHRGSSPFDDEAIKVGNLDSSVVSASVEHKSFSSETGPGVDLYAAGSNVMSACSNTNAFSATSYSKDSGFKQVVLTGTSQASPQVCGLIALYLQMNPGAKPNAIKNWLINKTASGNMYNTISDTDYTDLLSLNGGENKMLYNPFGLFEQKLTSNLTITDGAVSLIK